VSLLAHWHALLREQSPVAVATVIEGPGNSLGGKVLVTPEDHEGGAGDEDLARIGKFLGYRVIVCDARAVFATRERFPSADEVVVAWPDEFLKTAEVDGRSVICVLTHDPKFDVPVLKAALQTEAGYIGAMGSRRTHNNRTARLKEEGTSEEQLARISSPIGLDIGSRTPEETAVAIAAEIIAFRTGHAGGRLAERSGPIHAPDPDVVDSPDAKDAKREAEREAAGAARDAR
jgi:xanthine dehydrogenase accessory factor